MKRVLFKGRIFYIPENIGVDEAVPIMNRAYAHSNLAEEMWKDAGTEIAQVTRAGEYTIKLLSDGIKIYLSPDFFTTEEPFDIITERETVEKKYHLAICTGYRGWEYTGIYGDGHFSLENILPSENDNFLMPTEETFLVIDQRINPDQIEHREYQQIPWVGREAVSGGDYHDFHYAYHYYTGFKTWNLHNLACKVVDTEEVIICTAYCVGGLDPYNCCPCTCVREDFITPADPPIEWVIDEYYHTWLQDDETGSKLQQATRHTHQDLIFHGLESGFTDDQCAASLEWSQEGDRVYYKSNTKWDAPDGNTYLFYAWGLKQFPSALVTYKITINDRTWDIFTGLDFPHDGYYDVTCTYCQIHADGNTPVFCYCYLTRKQHADPPNYAFFGIIVNGVHESMVLDNPTPFFSDLWGYGDFSGRVYPIVSTNTVITSPSATVNAKIGYKLTDDEPIER